MAGHVALLAEWHNYAECNFSGMTLGINYSKKRANLKRSHRVKYRGLKPLRTEEQR